ncbi:MAG: Maf family protein [Candidatus Faecousia sp.]|nr:Maf family protein [Candidatus Faecousia sp.]
MQLILASASPRRKELLGLYGIPFTVRAADIDETMDPDKPPFDEVARLSREKALAVPREPEDVVVAADTIVVCDGIVLGKPKDEAQAIEMLSLLSGRAHQVMTGCTVLRGQKDETFTEVTDIHFRPLSPGEIRRYVATGEPMDKAGAYGIQGGAALFCQRMEGDYYNVMGLPVCALGQVLKQIAPEWMEEQQA